MMQITSHYFNYQVSSSFDHPTANSNANHRITSNVLFFFLGGHDEPRLLYSRAQLGLFIRVILSFFSFFFSFSNLHANPLIKSSKSIPRTAGRAPAAVSLSCSSLAHLILRRERSLLSLVAASDLASALCAGRVALRALMVHHLLPPRHPSYSCFLE